MRRIVQPLTLAEERELARLIASGRNAIAARQYIAEDRFRSRSQRREGDGCSRPVSDSLNSVQEVGPFHVANMERKHEPSPEKLVPENGKSRDDHVPGSNR